MQTARRPSHVVGSDLLSDGAIHGSRSVIAPSCEFRTRQLSMDPNRYEVSEPELLLRKLRATGAFAFTDGEPRCCRQAACSNVLWDPDSFGLSGRLAVSGDLLIVRSIPQQVVDDHEERMRHRHRGALLASISGDPAELPR